MKIAITGASGKTGYRIAEEGQQAGHKLRLLLRQGSVLPKGLSNFEQVVFSLGDSQSLDSALSGCDCLIIATGARPSADLTGPARVDAFGIQSQVNSAKRVGVKRVILVSSLCAGRWIHPLNLFGLILVWKRVGEKALERSSLDWTVIRPGGLSERETELEKEGILFTGPDQQQDAYIPRRLLARTCVEAIKAPSSIGRIIEVTSSPELPKISLEKALRA